MTRDDSSIRADTVYVSGAVVGYVRDSGCENVECLEAIARGVRWHATPPMGKGTLPRYHYSSRESAVAVLVAAASGWVGDHDPSCDVVRNRRNLLADMVADPGNRYLQGAWVEYFAGGDQETELCDCGRFPDVPPVYQLSFADASALVSLASDFFELVDRIGATDDDEWSDSLATVETVGTRLAAWTTANRKDQT